MKRKLIVFTIAMISLLVCFFSNPSSAHRCKPYSIDPFRYSCDLKIKEPYNSMYVESDCTMYDEPPGNVPRKLPTPCDGEKFVSYVWQEIRDIGGDAGCSAECWGCDPGDVPTMSIREAKCPAI
jgi:hypothetical protein